MPASPDVTPLSPVDTAWLRLDAPTNPMMITAVLWFDEAVDWTKLETVVGARLLDRYPKFRQRIVTLSGDAVWEDDPGFDLDEHLTRVRLPEPGDREALRTLVSEQMSTPLAMDRSPWQLHLVDGFQGGCAILARLHHCIADGIALASVLLSLTDQQTDEGAVPTPPPSARVVVGGRLAPTRRLLDALWHGSRRVLRVAARQPRQVAHAVVLGVTGVASLIRLLSLPRDPGSVFRAPLGTAKTAAWSSPVSLPAIKRVAAASGGTVNDVLLAATAGALRRYALARGALPTDVRTAVPVNLRDLDEPIPPELGNRFGLVFVDLPVGAADPLRRLQRVQAATRSALLGPQALAVFGLLWLVGQLPPFVERMAAALLGKRSSSVTTNVPGPREPVLLAGSEVAGIVFWVPQSGVVGLGVSLFSYADEVTVGFAADRNVVPDTEALARHLEEEVAALVASVAD